jgi:hypothetical protein
MAPKTIWPPLPTQMQQMQQQQQQQISKYIYTN